MSDVPKIVYDRMRAAQPQGRHPDPDLLTAFVEQTLSDGERENVLLHLVACRDCRETVALSLPAVEVATQPTPEPAGAAAVRTIQIRRRWLAWPTLRWAGLAAGVVVVASALLLRPGKPPQNPAVDSLNREVQAPVAAANNEIKTETKAAPPSSAPPSRTMAADEKNRTVARERSAESHGLSQAEAPVPRVQERGEISGLKSQLQEPGRTAGTLARDNAVLDSYRGDSGEADKLTARLPKSAGIPVAAAAPASAPAISAAETAAPEQALDDQQLLAENRVKTAAIQKAKPAKKDEATEGRKTLAKTKGEALGESSNYAFSVSAPVRALWRVSEGSLQRSVDAGSTWQTVVRSDHKLLCRAVRGNEIWAGGQAGTLYLSNDAGMTWTKLHPAISGTMMTKDQPLSADILRIEIDGRGAVSIFTNQDEAWTSRDGGKTWSKSPVVSR